MALSNGFSDNFSGAFPSHIRKKAKKLNRTTAKLVGKPASLWAKCKELATVKEGCALFDFTAGLGGDGADPRMTA